MVFSCSQASAGQGSGDLVPHGDFEQGFAGWLQTSSDGSSPFAAALSPDGRGGAARCTLGSGRTAVAELRVPIAPGQIVASAPSAGSPGEKYEFGVWVWPSASWNSGSVWISLESHDGLASSVLAESTRYQHSQLPKERWTFVATQGLAPHDARIPSAATEMRYRVHCEGTGTLWFDTAVAGVFDFSECALLSASFENWEPASSDWDVTGIVRKGPTANTSDGYYGSGFAVLEGGVGTSLSQTISCGGEPHASAAAIAPGREVEAGLWLHLDQVAALPTTPSPSIWCEVAVYGIAATTGAERLLAEGRWYPIASEASHWRFLQTEPVNTVSPVETKLRVVIQKSFVTDLVLDFVQLGERHALDGNPRKRVSCNYVGRYRSPNFPGASTNPTTAQGIWRNWCWTAPPGCNNSFVGFFHNPDCNSSAACIRSNGRRDAAISTFRGENQLPLIGTYDSRDPEVLRYHADLARAAGIDHFVFDYQGHKLATQQVQNGEEPLNEQSWEALVEVAEEAGSDLKVAVMYEPKVHFLGWVTGEPTKADKMAGIVQDLVHLSQTMAGRRSALRRDGRLIVFIFRNKTCNPAATQCLDEASWLQIHQAVLAQSGEDLFLVGDTTPASGSALQGFTRWQLVSLGILEFRNYIDAQFGSATVPPPSLATLEDHAQGLSEEVRDWTRTADDERVGIVTVWPGFDDSGVGGWGMNNLTGENGAPLCVRVAHDFDGAFYATTTASALDSGVDWIQITTWNDWNELTSIEPAWHPDLATAYLADQGALTAAEQHIYGRLVETQQWIQTFKGESRSPLSFRNIALGYISRANRLPEVPLYD